MRSDLFNANRTVGQPNAALAGANLMQRGIEMQEMDREAQIKMMALESISRSEKESSTVDVRALA